MDDVAPTLLDVLEVKGDGESLFEAESQPARETGEGSNCVLSDASRAFKQGAKSA